MRRQRELFGVYIRRYGFSRWGYYVYIEKVPEILHAQTTRIVWRLYQKVWFLTLCLLCFSRWGYYVCIEKVPEILDAQKTRIV